METVNMHLRDILTIEIYKYGKRLILCQIKIKPLTINNYKEPPTIKHRWFEGETNWRKFETELHRELDKYDFTNSKLPDISGQFFVNSIIQVQFASSSKLLEVDCSHLKSIGIDQHEVALALACIIECGDSYRDYRVSDKLKKTESTIVTEAEYQPETHSPHAYLPYTPSKRRGCNCEIPNCDRQTIDEQYTPKSIEEGEIKDETNLPPYKATRIQHNHGKQDEKTTALVAAPDSKAPIRRRRETASERSDNQGEPRRKISRQFSESDSSTSVHNNKLKDNDSLANIAHDNITSRRCSSSLSRDDHLANIANDSTTSNRSSSSLSRGERLSKESCSSKATANGLGNEVSPEYICPRVKARISRVKSNTTPPTTLQRNTESSSSTPLQDVLGKSSVPTVHDAKSPLRRSERSPTKTERYIKFKEYKVPKKVRKPEADSEQTPTGEKKAIMEKLFGLDEECNEKRSNLTPSSSSGANNCRRQQKPKGESSLGSNTLANSKTQAGHFSQIFQLLAKIPDRPPPNNILKPTLTNLSMTEIKVSFETFKPEIDKLWRDYKNSHVLHNFSCISKKHITNLLGENNLEKMMKILTAVYKIPPNSKQNSILHSNAMLPTWTILLLMNRYNISRDEAIKHIIPQQDYDGYMKHVGKKC